MDIRGQIQHFKLESSECLNGVSHHKDHWCQWVVWTGFFLIMTYFERNFHAMPFNLSCDVHRTILVHEVNDAVVPSEQPHSHFMGVMFIHKTLPTHFYRSIIYQDAFRMSYRSDPVFSYTVYTSRNYFCSLIYYLCFNNYWTSSSIKERKDNTQEIICWLSK